MLRVPFGLTVISAGLLAISAFLPVGAPLAPAQPAGAAISSAEFRTTMRKLWEDHITWTRVYVISVANGLPDREHAAQRLLQNQADIGNAIKPFYGDQAGTQLTGLLREHILGAVDLLNAAKAGDAGGAEAARIKWYANGDQIATFLTAANPGQWPLQVAKDEMRMHLDLTLAEATARIKADYVSDVPAYDQVHLHILRFADILSNGIIAQFPGSFDGATPDKTLELRAGMRKLWEDHIQWTRFYIISVARALGDRQQAAQRLIQNQTDIGNAIKPFYGDQAGTQLTALLRDHILGAVELLDAAKAGDSSGLEAARVKWYANGDQIAAFLTAANPGHWPAQVTKDEMRMHLDLTLKEATARLQGDYAGDVVAYDQVHDHILRLADTLTTGLVAQFSGQFPGTQPSVPGASPDRRRRHG